MKPQAGDSAGGSDALGALRAEVARLSERIAALEAAVPSPRPSPPSPLVGEGGRGGEGAEPISEEVLAVISAAIAAFLGKKASIRQIRLLGAAAWSQQGRVTIQASHALSVRQTRSPH